MANHKSDAQIFLQITSLHLKTKANLPNLASDAIITVFYILVDKLFHSFNYSLHIVHTITQSERDSRDLMSVFNTKIGRYKKS